MNSRHLPAGPAMQGVGGPGSAVGGDMPTGPVQGGGGGGGGGGGNRRRGPPQHYGHQQYQQPMHPYSNYMPPYGQYYHPQMHPQYQNGNMPSPGYMPYPAQYAARSPPMQQYVPMVGVSVQQGFSPRQSQNSPALSTPYHPPAAPSAPPLATPQQPPTLPQSPHIPTPITSPPPPPEPVEPVKAASAPAPPQPQPEPTPAVVRPRFRPPLPWLSKPDESFPKRLPRKSKRRQKAALSDETRVELPTEQHEGSAEEAAQAKEPQPSTPIPAAATTSGAPAAVERSETPSTQDQPSEGPSTSPTTPSSTHPGATSNASITPTAAKPASRTAVPALPIVPAIPRPSAKDAKAPTGDKPVGDDATSPKLAASRSVSDAKTQPETTEAAAGAESTQSPPVAPAPAPQKPKSWASLLSTPGPVAAKAGVPAGAANAAPKNGPSGNAVLSTRNGNAGLYSKASTDSLAAALRSYRVGANQRISLIEPRGLTNGGNMCYMNSVLQVLLFCTPFYDFLDQVSRNAVHSFKSETPLIDAMIMFMKEFRALASAGSVDQLREKIKGKDKAYGEPLTPNFLYDEMKRSKWFATLEQGHQQDAEEFLGWLLQALDDECSKVMEANSFGMSAAKEQDGSLPASPSDSGEASEMWMEVGPRQKPSITRSAGSTSSSPVSKIFGGLLRSELRVPGKKPSITTEPYQPLQLDIGSPSIRNIIDAMKGLTSQEKLQGDFNAARGKNVEASKQVLIDELPPVLILHLKRFQYDAEGGITKISKKIGYPLELDIPREVLSRQKVVSLGNTMPRYRLFAVVYHHGKNAGVGHYTVDVRRQDGSQWIRFDDTKIEPVRAEDVASRGAEEESPKDTRKDGANAGTTNNNRFGAINGEENGEDEGWKQVSSAANGNKRWSSVVNGSNAKSGARTKSGQEGINERTVAYLLFYQRI